MTPFEENICHCVSSNKVISQWQMRREEVTSDQLYLIKENLESRRKVLRKQYTLTLFVKNTGGDGEVSFSFFPDDPNFESKLENALCAARLIHNPHFELPASPQMYFQPEILDTQGITNPDQTLLTLRERMIASVKTSKGVRLASAEFYLDHHRITLKNSKDLLAETEFSSIHIDFVLLAGNGLKETETIPVHGSRKHSENSCPGRYKL